MNFLAYMLKNNLSIKLNTSPPLWNMVMEMQQFILGFLFFLQKERNVSELMRI